MTRLLALALLTLPLDLFARVEPRAGEEPIAAEPDITIVQEQDKVMHIHQINGKIYGVRVVPKQGVPYSLVDTNGDGNFTRNAGDRILVPEWVLISW
ncbi:DUF2782 domain-containing protein [Ketobacter sp. MCCC 1A13808]|uniref:DUF2782 domain-containing protein n=1 Tax=Ketobacter sp. MCCC 1A13808 TaxID=2602738 RepID=UPI000F23901F|nr:DUF2782 domain-containing protein [Ketobacter sp. MCCC 1A13808]MVF11924.1 DUF2782 domain-containing protein [Ketobacter sp. MCCC 1A13808]RLP52872.1 MAG: DUF2782 domain-containing protein [Ketobacter sp.]